MADRPDPAVHDFVRDPLGFLTPPRSDPRFPVSTVVSSYNMFPAHRKAQPGGIPEQGYFKFVLDHEDARRRTFEIKYHGDKESADTIFAYNLGYNGGALTSRRPAFIDIPKRVEENTLLFTGTLSGCSVIVTNLDDNTYRVFHDSRVDSSLLYNNVEMAVDFSDYSFAGLGMACVFMQYRNGRWNMFVQLQFLETVGGRAVIVQRRTEILLGLDGAHLPEIGHEFRLQTGYLPVMILEPGSYDAPHARALFDVKRETNEKRLRHLALEAFPNINIPNEPDGNFEPFEGNKISLQNPAVRRTQAIRDVVALPQDSIETQFVTAQGEYGLVDSVLNLQNIKLKDLVDPARKESEFLDFIYLWIKQKEAKGLDAVVITDGRLEARVGSTAGERLTGQQLDTLLARDREFAAGYNGFDQVEIPGWASDMTSLEMTELFDLSPSLTQSQMGALVRHISVTRAEEFEKVWEQTDSIIDMFQKAGGSTKPMPQDLLLNAVPDELGGRCYPLVRAMSAALARSDFAVDQLGIKLVSLSPSSRTDLKDAELFRQCLKDLHASYPAAAASTLIGRTNIEDAVNKLSAVEGKSTIFALNTDTHAMLLGATNRGGTTSYHFYDPNFTIASFASQQELVHATMKFFTEFKFADLYGAGGTPSDPIFTLVKLDTNKMARIGFDFKLNVADFFEPETLTETVSIKAVTELQLPDPAHFTENRALGAGAGLLEASELSEAWLNATAKLEASNGLGEHWMPILETLENVDSGGYRIQFINLKDPGETRWISTEDSEIKEFKVYLDERLKAVNKAYRFEHGTFVLNEDVMSAEATDGLNAMFVVKTLIEHFSNRKDSSQENKNANTNLAMALKVQSYINLVQLGDQSLSDVVKVVKLTQTLIRSEEAAQSSLSAITRALSQTTEGVNLILGGANVVLDAYMLSKAQDEIEKAVYGTQLAFDSASFLASAGSLGAGMVGASSASAVLGGASVILGGLAFGFGALASAFGKVAEDAQTVGKYFGETEAAYKAGGYKYDKEHKILVPLVGAVISELSLTGDVKFDSQYIYRTRHGSTGSGYINYFFWVGDSPQMVRDKSQALNVREGIGAPASGTLATILDYTTIILPATPKSYISYEYMILPFATSRHDYGFDVIRRLEVDGRFDYDFYVFPSEYIIRRISHEYVKTLITVKLSERPVRVQVPSLPNNMHGVIKYTLHGAGADYTVGFMAGIEVILSSTKNTRWILDCGDLTDDQITVGSDSVLVAGVRVTITDRNFTSILVINKQKEVLQVDFDNHNTFVVKEDASQFPDGNEKILAHLNELNDKHLLRGMFITIENCTTPSGRAVGRAFYDITKKRLLYTVDAPILLTEDVQFGADTSRDEVYFYNTEHSSIWRVDPAVGTCLAKYNALYPSPNRTLTRVWKEDDYVHAVFRHHLAGNKFGELSYVLEANSMTLVSLVGDSDSLHRLNGMDKLEPTSIDWLLKPYDAGVKDPLPTPTDSLPGKNIKAVVASHMLSVFGVDDQKVPYRFWIRFADGTIIKPSFSPPADVVLAGVIALPGGNEEFCFYSLKEQRIVVQRGTGTQSGKPVDVTVPAVFGELSNVLCVESKLFAVTTSGYVLRITSQGTLFLEAVNRQWFVQFESDKKTGPWWTVLKEFAEIQGARTVAILGLHDSNHTIIPAWLCNGRIVISSSLLCEQQLQLVGLAEGGKEAWLSHWKTDSSQLYGQLYSQPLVPDDQLVAVLSPNTPLVFSESKVPEGKKVLEPYPCKMVVMTNNGLQYNTTEGIILIITNQDTITLYGVDKDWQQNHIHSLEAALDELKKNWDHGEVIVMQGLKPTSAPSWYLVPAGKVVAVTVDNITWLDNPLWLGTDASGATGYFYLASRGIIYSFEVGKPAKAEREVAMAARFDRLLVLVPRRGTYLSLFTLWKFWDVKLSQPKGEERSPIPEASNYAIVVGWNNSCQVEVARSSTVSDDTRALLAKKIGHNLVVVNVSTGRSLTIRKAFTAVPTHTDITVKFTNLGFTILPADLQSMHAWLYEDAVELNTVKSVGHHVQNSKF
ncbi:hypothetical protein E1B28_001629 [Marasmius oreades]|uniref:TcdA/TcdB toxin pore forming domain-containing protein n=1 Tax=Marasmius oreades TaxID=181124 RepID=A0A9P7V3S9_9AGAR|nr:uncharacterized protein E1B28_001629 [Marasmius oreades]KAG7099820.1 hypothetical protein E1B28_001629 [Marasmius oreades]